MYRFIVVCSTILFCSLSLAQNKQWFVGQANDQSYRYAALLNDSSSILMQQCYVESETCYWSVLLQNKCTEEVEVAVLISSDEGALSTNLKCGNYIQLAGEPYYRLMFADFKEIDRLIRDAASIGIAFALKSGKFQVVRFELGDAAKSINSMRAAAQFDIDKKPKRSSTRNQTL